MRFDHLADAATRFARTLNPLRLARRPARARLAPRGEGVLLVFLAASALLHPGCGEDRPLLHPENKPPEILSLVADPDTLPPGSTASLRCQALDSDGDSLTYTWTAERGQLLRQDLLGAEVEWQAPDSTGLVRISVVVTDGDLEDQAQLDLLVIARIGLVTGAVLETQTLAPLAGARVEIGGSSTTSAADGSYTIEGLPLGMHAVAVDLQGYDPFSSQIEVEEGTNQLDVTLTPSVPRTRLRGLVTNSLSDPVVGATCRVADLEVQTGADGRYDFPSVPQGPQQLAISQPGYFTFRTDLTLGPEERVQDAVLDAQTVDPPADLRVTKNADGTMTVSWRPPAVLETVTGYRLYRSENSGPAILVPGGLIPAEATSGSFPGTIHHRYRFLIETLNIEGEEGGTSLPSNIVVLTPWSALVSIPAGAFVMGDTPDGWGAGDHPGNPVSTGGFQIEQTEVSKRQYAAFLYEALSTNEIALTASEVQQNGQNLLVFSGSGIHYLSGEFVIDSGQEDHPVTGVTWLGADAYARHAGRRLPTEAEWEKAARGISTEAGVFGQSGLGFGTKYPWGLPEPDAERANYNQPGGSTHPVVSHPDGASMYWGEPIYNLAGNVWEWCADWFGAYVNPHTPPTSAQNKTIRGGSWQSDAGALRCGGRNSTSPIAATAFLGFRCAATP